MMRSGEIGTIFYEMINITGYGMCDYDYSTYYISRLVKVIKEIMNPLDIKYTTYQVQ